MRARDLLMEQNVTLDLARREAETAIRARNDFLAVMNHEMRTPMHAVINLIGISPQDLPKLFTRFAQNQSKSSSRNSGGSGLGVAICKRFVNLMDGHIWVESEGLGKGCMATFIVKLGIPEQLKETKFLVMLKIPSNHVCSYFSGLKVLVMDENSVSRAVTKGLLLHLGCDVATVGSSSECLQAVSQEHSVVFMDVYAPGIDGYKIAVQIHEKFAKRHERLLIVALTDHADKVTKDNCTRAGMDGLILKPVTLEKMRSALSELLEHRLLFEAI
ncbi:hypothetical protein SAY86_027912 [Trapa natans]|uniref:Response regulatory domain-containing protein n=1 Tax=Trapa natans TaxID=22666 RepID=A0AAN7RCR8_TRANT|nr:hypothetical protein SAY86_027912 [Trapa natans]